MAGTAAGAWADRMESVDLSHAAEAVWTAWKEVHLAPDGRVIDVLQQEASHSEGQGYGMLLATEFDDEPAFRRMYEWTELHLTQRQDALLAWRWLPASPNPVPDTNNASDGDLFYAWALVRAAHRWTEARYMTRAIAVAQALTQTCVIRNPARPESTLFLPAAHGFDHDSSVSINPSYYMPLAMREVAAATGETSLAVCAADGERLLEEIAAVGLVPDWIDVSANGWTPSERLPSNTGYEALRVALFLIWSGHHAHTAVRNIAGVYERVVRAGEPVPTVIEPGSGVVLDSSPDPGYRALAGLVRCATTSGIGADMPPFYPHQPYYPATLQLFAMIAANKVFPECVPV